VLGIRGRQVRLGIDAPTDVIVHREEIYVKIQQENRKAVGNVKTDLLGMVKMIRGKISGDSDSQKGSVVDFKDRPPDSRQTGA